MGWSLPGTFGYWGPKLARNVARDRAVGAALAAEGWRVLRVWEHDDRIRAAAAIADLPRGEDFGGATPRAGRGPSSEPG